MNTRKIALMALSVLLAGGMMVACVAPVVTTSQQPSPFEQTRAGTIHVDKLSAGTFAADVSSVVGASDAIQFKVTGYTTQTNPLLTLEQSDGTDVLTVSNAGNLVVAGTSDLKGNVADSGGALTIADNTLIDGAADAIQLTVQGYTTQTNVLQTWETSAGTDVATMSSAGALDVASTINFGTGNLYPMGYATSGYEVVCGTTGTFTETTSVSVTGITTATYAVVTQITDPASTGFLLTVDQPTTSTLTINSWESDATVGTTGVNAFYCVVGTE